MEYSAFIEAYPEFASLQEAVVTRQLTLSDKMLKKAAWGKFYDDAVALHTAHYLAIIYNISAAIETNGMRSPLSTIGTANNISASTSSLSEGSQLSGLVSSNSPIAANFARTEYGLQYLNLLYSVISPAFLSV